MPCARGSRLASTAMGNRGSERGQASAELVAVVPLLIVVGLVAAQLVVAGWGLWSAAAAARAGARAAHVGADAEAVAERAIPGPLSGDATADGAGLRVTVKAPALIPGLPAIPVSVTTALDPGAGL